MRHNEPSCIAAGALPWRSMSDRVRSGTPDSLPKLSVNTALALLVRPKCRPLAIMIAHDSSIIRPRIATTTQASNGIALRMKAKWLCPADCSSAP